MPDRRVSCSTSVWRAHGTMWIRDERVEVLSITRRLRSWPSCKFGVAEERLEK